MTSTTDTQLSNAVDLTDTVLITCSFTGCGGSRVIQDGKIIIDDDAIDADGITSKKLQWFPTDMLSFKDKHNKRLARYFDEIGIATPIGIVIDKNKLDDAEQFIASTTQDFYDDVDACVDRYDIILQNHATKAVQKSGNPRVGQIIKMVALSAEEFKSTFRVVSIPPLVLTTTTQAGASELTRLLNDSALEKLQETAHKLFYKSYFNKEKTTPTATTKSFELMDMVYNLSFANPKLSIVADGFADLMDSVLPNTEVTGKTFYALKSFVQSLTTEQSLAELLDPTSVHVDDEDDDVSVSAVPASTSLKNTPIAKPLSKTVSTPAQAAPSTSNVQVAASSPVSIELQSNSQSAFSGLINSFSGFSVGPSTVDQSPVEAVNEDSLEPANEQTTESIEVVESESNSLDSNTSSDPVIEPAPEILPSQTAPRVVPRKIQGFGSF